ncbi:MAG TPA: gas vesicle protein [Streptosporangiaceae bacterium]|nr:gas vesicle protein [Streptosporangiaceae bacterium]
MSAGQQAGLMTDSTWSDAGVDQQPIALVDLLDRVLAGGVVLAGEVTLALADVDMVTISVRALVASVGTLASQDQSHSP